MIKMIIMVVYHQTCPWGEIVTWSPNDFYMFVSVPIIELFFLKEILADL